MDIKTRNERVLAVENSSFIEKYHNEKAKQFIEFILGRYRKDGVKELDEDKLSGIERSELKNSFGNYNIRDEYFGLQREIYR
jgi:type I restriction enzyme R subunit